MKGSYSVATNAPVWVIAEQMNCRMLAVSLQLIGQARKLADRLETSVEAVLMGADMDLQPQQLIVAGADRVYVGNAPDFTHYQPELYTELIVNLAKTRQPEIMLIGSTAMGRELAPLLAARLKTGLTAHCIDLVLEENNILEAKIPAYGGLLSIICPEKRPQMATVAAGVFSMPEPDETRTGEIVRMEIPEHLPGRIQTLEIVSEKNYKGGPAVVLGDSQLAGKNKIKTR